MHAFLFIGGQTRIHTEIERFIQSKKFNLVLRRNIKKVEEIRELIKDTNLKFNKPTLYVLEDFDQTSEVAQNAFLKRLEEPGANLTFLLTAKSNSALPTISSRCQVVEFETQKSDSTENLLTGSLTSNFKLIDKIKSREEAKEFLMHNLSSKNQNKEYLKDIFHTYNRIESNANFGLQLTNLIIRIQNN